MLGVAVVIAVVVGGGHLAAGALGQVRGDTVTVSASVAVTPLPGWELAGRSGDPPGIRLTSGNTSLDVATIAFTGTDLELIASYVDEVLEPGAEHFRVSGEVVPVRLASGLTGSRIAYVGLFGDVQASIEGEVTGVVSPSGVGVIFDGWAPAAQLQMGIEDLHTMIDEAQIA